MCIHDKEFANDFKNELHATYGTYSKTVLFWIIMQWVVVFLTDVSGQPIGPISLKMGPLICPQMSVRMFLNQFKNIKRK
jgi:hypothetical protein